jgi:hypothetical protein
MRTKQKVPPNKPSVALRAAAFQQHMALKMFACPIDPIVKPVAPMQKSPKSHSKQSIPIPIPTSTIFESNSVSNKRDRYQRRLTLAERLGLVEAPPAPLTDEQFETVKIDAEKRGFYNQECPICLEKFGPDNLVLLSCSHLLHATCLMNFRRFSRGTQQLCPVCRSGYEFVEVHAETAYHHRCAIVIQRAFRRYLLRDRIGKQAANGSYLHRRWVMGKAQDASAKLANMIDHQSDAIDAMLSALDADLEYSRNIMKVMEERERKIDWNVTKQKAIERNQTECPVCLREMDVHHCEVTSCAHLFHRNCLQSWLNFCQTQDKPPSCPVCRNVFQHCPMCEEEMEMEMEKEKEVEREKEIPKPPKKKTKEKIERKRWH